MNLRILIIITGIIIFSGCTELNLNPRSQAASGNWYTNENQFEMALLEMYKPDYWYVENIRYHTDLNTDDFSSRNYTYPVSSGTLSSTDDIVSSLWTRMYRGVSYSNTILANLEKGAEFIAENKLKIFEAEARFFRACMYSKLISYFGDVVFYTKPISIEEAFELGRTDKNTILQSIYDDFDFASANLPESYGGSEFSRATKGMALAMKARIALYQEDWETARDAAKACMDLGIYSLHPDFRNLFLTTTDNIDEVIFKLPRSVKLGRTFGDEMPCITRNSGGNGVYGMSWDLFCAYLCTDGLPIYESPLFNPQDPFKNRDPRLTMTTAEWGTEWLGFEYNPHPDALKVLNYKTGELVANNDSKAVTVHCVYSGLIFKKWIDESWIDDYKAEPDFFIIRYADVLLMYAEAKIELNQIDQSVFDAMNMVRARAYEVDKSQTTEYPEINITDQNRLRTILRMERRMEFAWEGRRYMDLMRWRIAEKVLNYAKYGWYDDVLMRKMVDDGLWPLPEIPPIDENGIPDLTGIYDKGYYSILADWKFDASKNYLWPIPSSELLINENLIQNPGY